MESQEAVKANVLNVDLKPRRFQAPLQGELKHVAIGGLMKSQDEQSGEILRPATSA